MRNFSGLVVICAAVMSVPAQAAPTVRDGIAAWQKGEFAQAMAIWQPLAERDDADAAFNLGQAYRLGRGTPIDLGKAQQWFEKAARLGHLDAQTSLGLLLFQNGNRQAAVRWLKSAADKGEPRAMLVYGTALFNGDGAPSDPVMAYAYVSRAAAQGLPPARTTLADMDRLIPLEDRKKGLALAQAMAAGPPKLAQAPKDATPPAASPPPAPAPVEPKPEKKPAARPTVASGATKPAPAAAPFGNWRIQLGAFSQKGAAQSLYARLSSLPALAGRSPAYVPAGKVVRLQVGPYDRAAATAACRALTARGQACFPVEAK